MSTYFARFWAGDCEEVWNELRGLGERVREEPIYSDALGVARETMRRVRSNIELLIPRLERVGYRFGYNGLAVDPEFAAHQPSVFKAPHRNVHHTLEQLEGLIGTLPMSLYAWYEQVGEVNFVGQAPDSWIPGGFKPEVLRRFGGFGSGGPAIGGDAFHEKHPYLLRQSSTRLDPLQVISPQAQFDLYVDWKTERDAYAALSDEMRAALGGDGGQFAVAIAPDADFKYDLGGRDAYEMAVPNRGIDARLLNEWHDTTFVEYLRICFRWAGFPGLEMSSDPPHELGDLTEGLLQF